MNKQKHSPLFLAVLLVMTLLSFVPLTFGSNKNLDCEDFSSYGKQEGVHFNHTDFWGVFEPKIQWGLSVNGIPHSLNVSEDYSSYEKCCKYTLSFLTSVSGNYTVSFVIELEFEEIEVEENKIKLTYKDADFEFESEYNWFDMLNVTGLTFDFSHVANETGFYFLATTFVLEGTHVLIDPVYEDFTEYTENPDPNNNIDVINSTNIQFKAYRDEDARLYMDYDVDFFGDFNHTVDVQIYISDSSSVAPVWGLTNDLNDYKGISNNGQTAIYVYMRRQTPSPQWLIALREYHDIDGGASESFVDNSILITSQTWYYLSISKESTNLTCVIYSNENRTTVFDTLHLTLQANHEFRYMMACNTQNTGHHLYGVVWIQNLNLNHPIYWVTFRFYVGGILKVDNVTVANGTQTVYWNGTVLELASLVSNASYVWLNFTWLGYNSTSNPYNFTVLSNSTLWCYFSQSPTYTSAILLVAIFIIVPIIIVLGVFVKWR